MVKIVKFGGTSLANISLIEKTADMLLKETHQKLVVVVSAMAGVTDHLVNLYHDLGPTDNQDANAEYANIITTGEQVSAGILAIILQKKGIKTRSLNAWQAGIITNDNYKDAEAQQLNPQVFSEIFNQGYQIIVVAGFQGITEQHRITTLGRGGSDITAVLIAAALDSNECYIYSDVAGVFSADPRIVAKAKQIPVIDYDLMIAYAESGAKVLQAKSVILAKKNLINIYVASSFTHKIGTLVTNHTASEAVIGIGLSSIDNQNCKISLIGYTDNQQMLKNKILQKFANENIQVLDFYDNNLQLDIVIKDQYKFIATKLLHQICGLE